MLKNSFRLPETMVCGSLKLSMAQIRLVVLEKNAPLILKNDVTKLKARLLFITS